MTEPAQPALASNTGRPTHVSLWRQLCKAYWVAAFLIHNQGEGIAASSGPIQAAAIRLAATLPLGVTVVRDLTSNVGGISLTGTGSKESVFVVTAVGEEVEGLRRNAFAYGESHDSNARCLFISDETVSQQEPRHWFLCGQSPLLVLRPDILPEQMGGLVKRLQRTAAKRIMPAYLRKAVRGDVLMLQTEGGESALYFDKDGPVWTELPGSD